MGWVTAFTASAWTGTDTNWSTDSLRIVIEAAALSYAGTGTKIRLTMSGSSNALGTQIAGMYVGHQAAAGDAYDFDGNQVQILQGASGSFTIATSADELSDEINFAYDGSKDLVISIQATGGAGADWLREVTMTNVAGYFKDDVTGEQATTNVSTYSSYESHKFVALIEVFAPDKATTVINGQFQPFVPLQGRAGLIGPIADEAPVADITVVDDGGHLSDGGGSSTPSFSSLTSTGPDTILIFMWEALAVRTLNSASFNGNAVTILEQAAHGSAAFNGVAICHVAGAQSGSLTTSLSGAISGAFTVTILSLGNLQSATPVDTDEATGNGATIQLTALSSPGPGGVRIAGLCNTGDTTAVTWTGLSQEPTDSDVGAYRHSVAYEVGDSGATITADGATATQALVGVSLR